MASARGRNAVTIGVHRGTVPQSIPARGQRESAGGVVVLRPLIVHASSKMKSDLSRRVLHIEYARSLDLGDGLNLRLA